MTDPFEIATSFREGAWWRGVLERSLPRPQALRPRRPERPRRILVLIKGPNPTFSYYMEARLLLGAAVPFHVHSIDDHAGIDVDPVGAYVIVCRYIRPRQIAWLRRNRDVLAGTAYFVDDDIASLVAGPGGGLLYRSYIAWFGAVPLRRLNRELTDIWVSTDALREALHYPHADIALLPPAPLLADNMPPPRIVASSTVKIAFHATDVHRPEHAFLVPIIKAVLAARPNAYFEVLARGRMKALWLNSGIHHERLHVLPLLAWPVYQQETRKQGADILVVPLSMKASDTVRADTKRIDCCRLGAAGLFAAGTVYGRGFVDGEILVEADKDRWVEALLRLVDSSELRSRAAGATRSSVMAMAETAKLGFPGLRNSADGLQAG